MLDYAAVARVFTEKARLGSGRGALSPTTRSGRAPAQAKASAAARAVPVTVLDMHKLAHSAGLDVDIAADAIGFRDESLYGQFTIRERSGS